LSRLRRKWYDIIVIDLQEVGCGRKNFIGLGQDRETGKLGLKITLIKPRPTCDDIIKLIFRKWDVGVCTASGC